MEQKRFMIIVFKVHGYWALPAYGPDGWSRHCMLPIAKGDIIHNWRNPWMFYDSKVFSAIKIAHGPKFRQIKIQLAIPSLKTISQTQAIKFFPRMFCAGAK